MPWRRSRSVFGTRGLAEIVRVELCHHVHRCRRDIPEPDKCST
jgi:hypothetical protein